MGLSEERTLKSSIFSLFVNVCGLLHCVPLYHYQSTLNTNFMTKAYILPEEYQRWLTHKTDHLENTNRAFTKQRLKENI